MPGLSSVNNQTSATNNMRNFYVKQNSSAKSDVYDRMKTIAQLACGHGFLDGKMILA